MTEEKNDLSVVISKKERFGFIDQFRGAVIFFFVLADITWQWSGSLSGIVINRTLTDWSGESPVGPTWLNHGWRFINFPQKQLITIIDIGQLLTLVSFCSSL